MLCKEHVRFGGRGQPRSYYGWRGADINNILNFELDWPEAAVIRLEENYRSVPGILECANTIIKNNKKRKDKTLWTANNEESQQITLKAFDEAAQEAFYIGKEIKRLIQTQGYDYDDFVILYRTNLQSRNFEQQFRNLDIPYKSVGSIAFYERAEVKDLLAYLSLIDNKKDDLSFMRIINTPRRGIGAKSLEKLNEYAQFKGFSLYEALEEVEKIPTMTKSVRSKFVGFRELMENMKTEIADLPLEEKVKVINTRSGYEDYLLKDKSINGEAKLENINELIAAAKEIPDGNIQTFLETAALTSSVDEMDNSKKVTLMTIHSAKGLEFPVVFLTGLEENLFPSYQSVQKNDIEEERRLCYVGITRAKEKLYLTYAKARFIHGDYRFQSPSQFLSELPKQFLLDSGIDFFDNEPETPEAQKPMFKPSVFEFTQDITIEAGDVVLHKQFGRGTVVQNNKGILTIAFPGLGVKKIAETFVELDS